MTEASKMTTGSCSGTRPTPSKSNIVGSALEADDQCIIDTLELILQQDWDKLVMETVRMFHEETKAKIEAERSASAGIASSRMAQADSGSNRGTVDGGDQAHDVEVRS
jgi:hypothetical protein